MIEIHKKELKKQLLRDDIFETMLKKPKLLGHTCA